MSDQQALFEASIKRYDGQPVYDGALTVTSAPMPWDDAIAWAWEWFNRPDGYDFEWAGARLVREGR